MRLNDVAGYYGLFRPEIVSMIPEDCKAVLDVGCGAGVLGKHLKEQGVEYVCGVELVPSVAELAREVLDEVCCGDLSELTLPFERASFDCIVCADILEHLIDPWETLRILKAYLKPSGCIVISLPNIGYYRVVIDLIRGRWQYADAGILDRTHLRFFTKKSMLSLLSENGFCISKHYKNVPDGKKMRLFNVLSLGQFEHLVVAQYVFRANVK